MVMTNPYQDASYAGDYAQSNRAQEAALAGAMTTNPQNMGGYLLEMAELNANSNNYVTIAEGRAQSAHLGTHSGPSAAGTIYTAISHDELYRATHTNIDPSGLFENGRSWNTVGNSYADTANTMLKAVADNQEGWTGPAADDFHTTFSALANHFGQTGEGAQAASAQLYQQSDAATTVRNTVPPPPKFDKNAALLAMLSSSGFGAFGGQSIAEQQQAADEAHAQAAEATQSYEQTVTHSVATSPQFTPPPQNTPSNGAKGGPGAAMPVVSGIGRHPLGSVSPNRAAGVAGGPGAPGYAGPPAGTSNPSGTTTPTGGTSITSDYLPIPTPDPIETGTPGGNPGNPNTAPPVELTGLPLGGGNLGGLGGEQVRSGSGFGGGAAGEWSGANGRNTLGGNGSGARTGIGAEVAEEAAMRNGVAAEGAAGRQGMSGLPGAGRGKKETDKEHKTAAYLESNELDQVITGDLGLTVAPVIGGEK
jgi:PPE family protein